MNKRIGFNQCLFLLAVIWIASAFWLILFSNKSNTITIPDTEPYYHDVQHDIKCWNNVISDDEVFYFCISPKFSSRSEY